MNDRAVKNNSNKDDDVIGFSIVDKTEDPTFFTGFLNDITKLESVQECKQIMRNLLSSQEAQSILDVGCGVGDDVRELAEVVDRSGKAVGIDSSKSMISEARKKGDRVWRNIENTFY